MTRFREARGFTLLEIAVVTLIAGVLLAAFLSLGKTQLASNRVNITNDRIQKIYEALNEYQGETGRYPCPAQADKGPIANPADYGEEACPALATVPLPGACSDGVCRASGRDADGDGTADTILIGTLPFKDIAPFLRYTDLSSETSEDAWYGRITYAVTESMTTTATFDSRNGIINIEDENGRDVVDPPNSVHYVLLSHGDNNLGAYARSGTILAACPVGTDETENCDHTSGGPDDTFVSGVRVLAGADYFDDLVKFVSWSSTEIWSYSPYSGIDPNTGSNRTMIYNAGNGNVGIGTDTPGADMDVTGILVGGGYHSDLFCDPTNTTVCTRPEFLGGDGSACGPNEAAIAIEENKFICRTIFSPIINSSCTGPNEFVRGISNLTGLICATY